MSFFFNTDFAAALKANPGLMTGATVRMVLFPHAPSFDSEGTDTTTSAYSGINTVDELAATLGWGPYITPMGPEATRTVASVDTTTAPPNAYVIFHDWFELGGASPEFPDTNIRAIAFVYEGPDAGMTGNIIFVSNSPVMVSSTYSGVGALLTKNDTIVSQPVSYPFVAPNNAYLFTWSDPGGSAPLTMLEGPLAVFKGPAAYAHAHAQDVWVYPQRINFIANPSFEIDVNFWRANGAIDQSEEDDTVWGGGNFSGIVSGTILESNTFPLNLPQSKESGWTIQAQVRSDGEIKVGLVAWEPDFIVTNVDWGHTEERWLPMDGWIRIRTLRHLGDQTVGMLRIETDGSYIQIDQVCVEPGLLASNYNDWLYFDGDSLYETTNDFSWYGVPHESYSMWYNNRDAVMGRLFAWGLDPADQAPGGVLTDEETVKQGLVYQWVPAGTPVQEHLDVLYPFDPKASIAQVTGTVLPYKADPGDPDGVTNPWT